MGKRKLRRLVVDGEPFLWRLSTGYQRVPNIDHVDYTSLYTFEAYREGFRNARATAEFEAWESPGAGGPLHTGSALELGDPSSPHINLNRPRFAAELIRLLLRRGWRPHSATRPFVWRGERADLELLWARVTEDG